MQDETKIPIEVCGTLMDNEKYLTDRDIRLMFNIKQYTVKRWVKSGKLPQPSDSGLYREDEVIEYMTRRS